MAAFRHQSTVRDLCKLTYCHVFFVGHRVFYVTNRDIKFYGFVSSF